MHAGHENISEGLKREYFNACELEQALSNGSEHSEKPPGESQNLFATLTVCTYVWIVPNWTLQQSMAESVERRVRAVAYVRGGGGAMAVKYVKDGVSLP